MRPRAGTYAGYTSVESNKIQKILKTEPSPKESDEPEDKLGINKLLTEKRKFSRQNRWGNCSYKQMIVHAISNRYSSLLNRTSAGSLTFPVIFFTRFKTLFDLPVWLNLFPYIKKSQFRAVGTEGVKCLMHPQQLTGLSFTLFSEIFFNPYFFNPNFF